jgi:serine/threonine-protein kinase
LLPDKKLPLVLAIDDVDWLFQYPGICAEFCSMLRNWHERSKTQQIWKQLRLIVVLSTEEDIKLPPNQSLFNVGIEIKLTEFTIEQVQAFAQYYGLEDNAIQLAQWIDLVGGHPYLLSLTFSYLSMHPEVKVTDLLAVASTAQGIYSSYLIKFLEMLKQNPDLRKAFKSVVTSTEAVTLEISTGYKLQIMGLIKWQKNQALPSCRLYREFFSDHL